MKKKILRLFVEGKLFTELIVEGKLLFGILSFIWGIVGKIFRVIDRLIARGVRGILSSHTAVDNNVIMLIAFQGDYTDNPRAIADELIKQDLPYELVWVKKKSQRISNFPEELTLVNRGSLEFFQYLFKSKIIIDNTHDLFRLRAKVKDEQIYLQTWHGSLGIKRLDGEVVQGAKWDKIAKYSQESTSYCISNSTFETEVYNTSYWKGVPTLDLGHARNDILFSDAEKLAEIKRETLERLGVEGDKKVILYAPTHRDDRPTEITLDFPEVVAAFEKRFGGEWIVLSRLHSRDKKLAAKLSRDFPDSVVDATFYPDIQDLMICADAGITDYSSWIFDFLFLNRPGFIYADDLAEYESGRSFYYPLEETPFPIAESSAELCTKVQSFDDPAYQQKTVEFLEARGCFEDGHASERIVEKIKELLA